MTQPKVVDVRARQQPLRDRYKVAPAEALITDHARTINGVETDPFHGTVVPGSQDYGVEWPFGIHRAVGGDHDGPNPGDLLCAALATCLDSTIRIIANRLAITLVSLEVDVSADVDVRGTLVVDRAVPVGFQTMRCQVKIQAAEGTDPSLVEKLLAAAEYSCVNLQTLRSGVAIELGVKSN
ncbi:MAG TPA: OsmC family protein [Ktedonobacterales bacterium]|nr:OsmC family protein [Ktedonobacterales bacterium]